MPLQFLPQPTDDYDAAIEDAIATCGGDIRGALKALLIVNEQLEKELSEIQAAMAPSETTESRTDPSVH
jgi:hypothetical protein